MKIIVLKFMLVIGFLSLSYAAYSETIVNTGSRHCYDDTLCSDSGLALNVYQWGAARFTLSNDTTLTSLETWMWSYVPGLTYTITIYGGDTRPDPDIVYYSQAASTVYNPEDGYNYGWQGLYDLDWSLLAGDYWLAFEVHEGQTYDDTLPSGEINGPPYPLPAEDYAYLIDGIYGTEWTACSETNNCSFAVRIEGFVPGILNPPELYIEEPLNSGNCVEATGPDGAFINIYSTNPNEYDVLYQWETSSSVTGNSDTLGIQVGVDETVEAALTVTNPSNGETATSIMSVCVSDTVGPEVHILSPVDGEIVNSNNTELEVIISDDVDVNINEYDVFVGIEYTKPYSEADRQRVKLFRSTDENAEVDIQIKARDYSGNEGVAAITVIQR